MGKHAYLLMVHEDTLVLKRLIQLIDSNLNDIYIHIDKNAKKVNPSGLEKLVKCSKIYFVKRHRVYWGTNSITQAEIELFRAAVKQKYRYYHLLSGADLPIKTQKEIHDFFEENKGKEFIHFGTEQYQKDIQERYNQYHFFTKQLGRKRDKKLWVQLETYSLAIQRRLQINRLKSCEFQFYGGANWCSVTYDFVVCILKEYKRLRHHLCFTQNSDETLVQTIVLNSDFSAKLYETEFSNSQISNIREIDWNRGNPYVFHTEDFEMLMNSPCMFARKFDENVDQKIIEQIYDKINTEQKADGK